MTAFMLQSTPAPEITLVGVLVPGVIFAISFVMTLLLYRHFSRHSGGPEG